MVLEMDQKKIRIFSKKLSSGNCQVKFFVDSQTGKPYYGYMLASPGQKLSEVITVIYRKLHDLEAGHGVSNQKSMWINNRHYIEPGFMLFEDKP